MNRALIKLAAYFGERDRSGSQPLHAVLTDIFARHDVHTSVLLRGFTGFGVKHHLRDDLHLTLSEDLPLMVVAIETPEKIDAALREVERLRFDGLLTLERARSISGPIDSGAAPGHRLTLYAGRHERREGRPLHRAAVQAMHRHGLAAAAVLLGVDGTLEGTRRRARFFAANARVPLMITGVGRAEAAAAAARELGQLAPEALLTEERIRLCRQGGRRLESAHEPPPRDQRGRQIWQQLTIFTEESADRHGHPQHAELVRALRSAGARGATCLRGLWGFHDNHEPRGDSFWGLRRRLPVVTTVIDTPDRIAELLPLVEQVTAEAGVVTSELVPASRATGPEITLGSLELAQP